MPFLPTSFHDPAAQAFLEAQPQGRSHHSTLRKALYKDGLAWEDALGLLPPGVAEALALRFSWRSAELLQTVEASDGSTKALWQTADGLRYESVLMRRRGRTTLCVSSQVGCALGCVFCATGTLGLHRDLTPGEILDQAAWAAGVLRAEGRRLRNVVFMGMGEPLLALASVAPALEALVDQRRFEVAPRYLCVSTAGVTPAIVPFSQAFPRVKLAVSLHAPRQDLRDRLLPGCRQWPLDGLMAALDVYAAVTGHRLFFEYVMLEGVNDGERECRELIGLLGGRDAHVNLIPASDTGFTTHRPSGRAALDRFQQGLVQAGIPATVRHSAGETIAAACGQLAGNDPSGNRRGNASSTVEANRN